MNPPPFPEPKDAATVILLRPQGTAFDVLMVKRHPANLFLPDRYVFPGGSIDDADLTDTLAGLCSGLDRHRAHGMIQDLATAETALGVWIAGIREVFEETGLLLAYDADGTLVRQDSGAMTTRLASHRDSLRRGETTLENILKAERLTLATDRLHYFSHWLTPPGIPMRFDVRFFVAAAPAGQEALHDSKELTEHVWISPEKALDLYRNGQFEMVLPTIMTLEELRRFSSVEEVLNLTAGKNVSLSRTKFLKKGEKFVEVLADGKGFETPY